MSFLPSIIQSYAQQRSMIKFLKKSENWTIHQWHQYQLQQLQKLFNHCFEHVAYYKKLSNKYEIRFDDIKKLSDLKKIPFLTRNLVRLHANDLKADNYSKKAFKLKQTSGTSDHPLSFYLEKNTWLAHHMALNRMFMERAGYKRWKNTLSLVGIPEKERKHRLLHTLELSSLYLHQYCEEYIKKIKKYQPEFIVSYPSAIYFLAKYLNENNTPTPSNVSAVFCHGEPVYEWQRKSIEQAFSCRVFDIYGNGEKNVISATCEESYLHHVFPIYCIVELIDAQGNPVTKEGKKGEIVTTSLLSYIFPFIRYKTGDVGVFTRQFCSCKRQYPVIKKITGRLQDGVVTKNYDVISSSKINQIVAMNSPSVFKWQFLQTEKGKLHLYLVKNKQKTSSESIIKNKIINAFLDEFANEFNLLIQFVSTLNQKRSRKHDFLIQHLPVNIIKGV